MSQRCIGVLAGNCPAPHARCHQGCRYANDNGEPTLVEAPEAVLPSSGPEPPPAETTAEFQLTSTEPIPQHGETHMHLHFYARPWLLGFKDGFASPYHLGSGITWNDDQGKNEAYDRGVNFGQRAGAFVAAVRRARQAYSEASKPQFAE